MLQTRTICDPQIAVLSLGVPCLSLMYVYKRDTEIIPNARVVFKYNLPYS